MHDLLELFPIDGIGVVLLFGVCVPAIVWYGYGVRIQALEDGILKRLFEDHHDIWTVELLRPRGQLWAPPDRSHNWFVGWNCPAFSDPKWLPRAPELEDEIRLIQSLQRKSMRPLAVMFAGIICLVVMKSPQ